MKLVFLHGLGQTAKAWDRVIDSLGDHDCLALELFDNGRLSESYEVMDAHVRQELACMDDDVVVVGLSLGASLAFRLLDNPPANVKGIIACAGQYNLRGNPFYYLQKAMFKLLPKSTFAKQGVDKVSLNKFYNSLAELDLTEVLTYTNLPCAIICGAKDKPNLKTSQKAADLIPNATYHTIPNAGHLLTDEAPEALAEVVQAFLKKIKSEKLEN
ncbi:alpha/beta fold hydrolase [Streptococcus moroccensis]|uniref:Pimeloyl-ACP methyl ester carboxylesterase n=1 Tax=Streptococcus moroccensis TaxID=1451356 RepID=A0ABT9YTH7_9STRE|nr:alpha/beta hydrolase [Streptococcus moroccensis]MDQ0222663.1 pimeloyl-ACP methyl ester carboxylesterase [Streptococcus moroccensis]